MHISAALDQLFEESSWSMKDHGIRCRLSLNQSGRIRLVMEGVITEVGHIVSDTGKQDLERTDVDLIQGVSTDIMDVMMTRGRTEVIRNYGVEGMHIGTDG